MLAPDRPRGSLPRHAVVVHALVATALFAWAFTVFERSRPSVSFRGDESDWILTSRYFSDLFLKLDFAGETWAREYWTLTQPPGYRYIVGASLWLQGYDPIKVARRELETRRSGQPTPTPLLMDARRASVIFGAGAVALLYVLGVQLGSPLAGVVAALLAGASPYLQEHVPRVRAESAFMFWLLAALALCLMAFRGGRAGFGVPSGLLAGAALGLALSIKLTAFLSIPAVGLACPAAALTARLHGGRRGWLRPLAWGALLVLTSFGLFIALNPFLWPDPPGRTGAMLGQRQGELFRRQPNRAPDEAVRDPRDRPSLVFGHTLVNRTWAQSTLGVPIDVPLATLGLVALGAAARREWRGRHDAPPSGSADLASRRRVGPAAFFLCWLAAYSAGVTWGFGMNWDRYAMPLFLPATILSGLGAHLILDWLRLGLAGTRRVVGARAGA